MSLTHRHATLAASVAVATLVLGGRVSAQFVDDREATHETSWTCRHGQSASQLDQLAQQGFRITDLELSPKSNDRFSCVAVKNVGVFKKDAAHVAKISQVALNNAIKIGNWRPTDLEIYDTNLGVRFAATLVRKTGADNLKSAWAFGSSSYLRGKQKQLGMRPISLSSAIIGNKRLFAAVFVENTGAAKRDWHWNFEVDSVAMQTQWILDKMHPYAIEHHGGKTFSYIATKSLDDDEKRDWKFTTSPTVHAAKNRKRPIDIESYTANGKTYYHALFIPNDYVDGKFRNFGLSCPFPTPMKHSASGRPDTGAKPTFFVSQAPANKPALLQVGFSDKKWGLFPLPLLLTPFGATHCRLYTDPAVTFASATNGLGVASVQIAIPKDRSLVGESFFTQFWVPSAKNALGLVFTNGVETTIGGHR